MNSIKNFIKSVHTPKAEDFEKYGYITPQQFEEAGDQLIAVGWKWNQAIEKQNKNLNPKKQFLSTKGRSSQRIKDIMNEKYNEIINEHGFLQVAEEQQNNQKNIQKNDDEFIAIPCRTYDLSITYDEYYHTPRMWLTGTNEDGQPLNIQQILEDIMSEYQGQTVTPEKHPHLGIKQITIHPCRHSQVIKAFIDKAKENNVILKPNQCLLIFIKFMSSVMPTIEYDATTDLLFDQL